MDEPKTPIQLEPDGITPLYSTVPFDDWVDTSPCEFNYDWLVKATLKAPRTIKRHMKNGSFGPVTKVTRDMFLFSHGHRAICRYNNRRYKDIAKRTVVDANDLRILKKQDEDNYDHDAFIAIRKHSAPAAKRFAERRVADEIKNHMNMAAISHLRWRGLEKGTPKFEKAYQHQMAYYQNLYEKEVVLIRRTGSDGSNLKKALTLPASVLSIIDGRLSIAQAQYFIEEYLEHEEYQATRLESPTYRFRIIQSILEQINIQHRRDIQLLSGVHDKDNELALKDGIARFNALLPKEGVSKAAADQPEEPEDPVSSGAPDPSNYT